MATTAYLVSGFCNTCEAFLTVSTNEWTEFTPSYSTYENAELYSHPGLEQLNQNRPGVKDSELEGCTVQALLCKECQEQIGVTCVTAGAEKSHYRFVEALPWRCVVLTCLNSNRSFLKLEKLTLKSTTSNQVEQPNVRPRSSKRGGESKTAPIAQMTRSRAATTQEEHDVYIEADSSEENSPPTENDPAFQGPEIMQILQRQGNDINHIFTVIENLQRQTDSIASTVEELRRRNQSFGSGDVELLTDTVARVNRKVGELGPLKFELNLMKGKIKRLEDDKRRSATSGMDPPLRRRQSTPKTQKGNGNGDFDSMQIDPSLTDPRGPPSQLNTSPISVRLRPNDQAPNPLAKKKTIAPRQRHSAESAREARHLKILQSALITQNQPDGQDDDEVDDLANNSEEASRSRSGSIQQTTSARSSKPSNVFNSWGATVPTTSSFKGSVSHKRRRVTTTPPVENTDDSSSDTGFGSPTASAHGDSNNPNYRSLWAAEGSVRNHHGLMITRDGRIDGRSLKFEGKGHYKRDGPRDEEGYLLRIDGSRDKRSVRIIDAAKRRKEAKDAEVAAAGGRGDSGSANEILDEQLREAAFSGIEYEDSPSGESNGASRGQETPVVALD